MTDGLPQDAEDAVRHLLRERVGTSAAESPLRLIGSRRGYWVVAVAAPEPLIVKLVGPKAREPMFAPAGWAYRTAAQLTRLPLPPILALNDAMETLPFRYVVRPLIRGRTWQECRDALAGDEREAALAAIGAAVAELHSPRFGGFGPFSAVATVKPVGGLADALLWRAERIIRDTEARDAFRALIERERRLFTHPSAATLCHDDLHGANILLSEDGTALAGILDFDKAWAGPAESDLARMELWTGMTGSDFWETYLARHSLDHGYPDRRPIYQLLWCFEYGSNEPDHLELTNSLCRRLGVPEVRAFSA